MAKMKSNLTLRVDWPTYLKITKIAEAEARSTTNMIEYLMRKEVMRFEAEHGEIVLTDDDLYGNPDE